MEAACDSESHSKPLYMFLHTCDAVVHYKESFVSAMPLTLGPHCNSS